MNLIIGRGTIPYPAYANTHQMVESHFQQFFGGFHINKGTMGLALSVLHKRKLHAPIIVETGTSCYGTFSTLLFDKYLALVGDGTFYTCDIRNEPAIELIDKVSTRTGFAIQDSLEFLRNVDSFNIDLLYLDSLDLHLDLISATASALHGLSEFLYALPALKSGSLVLVDDTPVNLAYYESIGAPPSEICKFKAYSEIYGIVPGKGSLIKQFVTSANIGKILAHEYQLLIQIN